MEENNKKKKKMNKKAENDDMFASCSFSSLGLHLTLCEQLRERMGFEAPTQVQAQAIPVIRSGQHVDLNIKCKVILDQRQISV